MILGVILASLAATHASASTRHLELVDETIEGGSHYYEWAVEGTDLIRFCVRGAEDGNDWSVLLPDDDGGFRRAFDFMPLLIDEDGSWFFPEIEDVGGVLLSEEDGQLVLEASFMHDLDPTLGSHDHPEWQTNFPLILLAGEADGPREKTGWFWYQRAPLEEVARRATLMYRDVLVVPFGEFTVYFDQMLGAPVLGVDSVSGLDTLEFDLSYGNIYGDISDEVLMVSIWEPMSKFSVSERFSNAIFFGQDGSGAFWSVDSIPDVFSAWIELEEVEAGFVTLDLYSEEFYTPRLPERFYDRARNLVGQLGVPAGFVVSTQEVEFEILAATAAGEVLKKTLLFHCRPGD
jgi:hypothetical protein